MSDSDWSCAMLVGDTSRADGSTADLLSEEDREGALLEIFAEEKPCAAWRGLGKS